MKIEKFIPLQCLRHEYFIKDHLGNTRVVFRKEGEEGVALLQVGAKRRSRSRSEIRKTHYYPFGMEFMGTPSVTMNVENFYKYNGKELQDDGFDLDANGVVESRLLWYDYGARFYDAQLGRWHSVDPMADQRSWVSPYNYVQNNPILRIDSLGTIDTKYIDEKGGTIVETDDNCNSVFVIPDYVENEFISKVMELDKTGQIHDQKINKDLAGEFGIPIHNLKENDQTYASGDHADKNAFENGYKYGYQGKILKSVALQILQGIQPDINHHNDAAYNHLGRLQGKNDANEGRMNMFDPKPKNNKPKIKLKTVNFNPNITDKYVKNKY